MSALAHTMRLFLVLLFVLCTISSSLASPVEIAERDAHAEAEDGNWYYEYKRTYFPEYPPSCQICEQTTTTLIHVPMRL